MNKKSGIIFLSLALLLLIALIFYGRTIETETPEKTVEISPDTARAPEYFTFNEKIDSLISADSLIIISGEVSRNDFLAGIMLRRNVDYSVIDRLAKKSRDVFDVRRIRPQRKFSFLTTADSSEAIMFIYEINPVDLVVFDLRDTLSIYRDSRPVMTDTAYTGGVIETSIWNSLIDHDQDPVLAGYLFEILGWDVDFSSLQPGDSYRLVYEEEYVSGRKIGAGRILAANVTGSGRHYYAFYFPEEGEEKYFDENGRSLERIFLKVPLQYRRISSRFSHSRFHPILKRRRAHYGVDFAAPVGTPVRSIGDGTIIYAGRSGGAGRMVKIRHKGGFVSAYLHLSGYARGMRSGMKVSRGQIIAFVGSSGLSTGPHLDFRIYKNGKPMNPLTVDSPRLAPVDSSDMPEFKNTSEQLKKHLQNIPLQKNLAANKK